MNITRSIFGVLVITLLLFALIPGANCVSTNITEKNKSETISEFNLIHDPIYVGDMYIEGTGDYESSLVMATAEQNLKIKVDPGGSDIMFRADYLLQCTGLFDYGYVLLSVGGANSEDYYTEDSYDQGSLYTTLYDCKVGDIIVWILYVEYGDAFFLRPLVDVEGGAGMCWLKRNSRSISNHPFLQFLGRIINQFPYEFPIIKYLTDQLSDNILAIRGTIICE